MAKYLVLVLGLGLTLPDIRIAAAQNFEILDQRLNTNRQGYTVLRVWGSRYQMGYAMGAALAEDIVLSRDQLAQYAGTNYATLRDAMGSVIWLAQGIEDEIQGIVDGARSAFPQETLDDLDVKVLNTFGDWAYVSGCRSHSCWGSYVQAPTRTLSTRRLDFGTPFERVLHHVLCAFDPDDGSVRWVNLAWAGYVTVITAVNAHGTLASLHDFGPGATVAPDEVPRSVAARHVLTDVGLGPIAGHRAWAQGELGAMTVATSTFINYYVPEGNAGVFTCESGGPCGQLRIPQPDYLGGEAIITTNDQTDGHTMPGGGDFMDAYYQAGGPKSLEDHFELMGLTGLHLLSVDYRQPQDMTLWVHGRGRTDRIEVEWSTLFPQTPTDPDAGVPDAGAVDASVDARVSDAGPDAGAPGPGDRSDGCGCQSKASPHGQGGLPLPLVIGLLLVLWRWRRGPGRARGRR